MTKEAWFSTPHGPMRQREPVTRSVQPGHWYIDRDEKFHAYIDAACKPTKPPKWWRQIEKGEQFLHER